MKLPRFTFGLLFIFVFLQLVVLFKNLRDVEILAKSHEILYGHDIAVFVNLLESWTFPNRVIYLAVVIKHNLQMLWVALLFALGW